MEATTQPPPPPTSFFISSQPPPHLSSLSPYFHCHSVPPTSCSLSFSVLPSYWRVKGMLQSYWLHNRLLIPLSMKNKCTYITTGGGGLRKSKKAVSMKLEYRGVNMKKYCLKQLMYFRFHEDQLLIAGTIRLVPQKDVYSLEIFFFLSSFGVCYGIKVKRKRWTMLMLNLRDTGSISSIKQNLEDFYVFLFFLFFFVIEFSVFEVKSLHWKLFLCCSVLEFSSFPHSGFLFVCQRGLCSTVTGLRYCGRLRETDIKLSDYYCTFGKKWKRIQWKTLGLKLTIKKTT